ncbi:MAG: NAD(+)/NADH kinase [Lachnospiraceae bacterium]|jgi:NAD+ kinase|nr:NAD(+)/NADH kinase [Lachnospiraceae bacterium]
MKNVGIITNHTKDRELEYTKEVIDWLKSKGYYPIIETGSAEGAFNGEIFMGINEMCINCSFIIVLGGDGTILEAARRAAFCDIPLLGINLGNLGYLTDVDKSEGIKAIEKVLKGDYKTEKRMMIQAEILGKGSNESHIALNDICILRGNLSKMISLKVGVNDEYIDTYRADGIIISTPTGSTAYNLSAGGPILKPDIELIAITPICPHKMYSRPSVISANDEVYITIGDNPDEVVLSLDGQEHYKLSSGDIIKISRSQFYTTIIKTNDLGFYDILRKKFYH